MQTAMITCMTAPTMGLHFGSHDGLTLRFPRWAYTYTPTFPSTFPSTFSSTFWRVCNPPATVAGSPTRGSRTGTTRVANPLQDAGGLQTRQNVEVYVGESVGVNAGESVGVNVGESVGVNVGESVGAYVKCSH